MSRYSRSALLSFAVAATLGQLPAPVSAQQLEEIVDFSVNQTFTRSINTSLTVMLVLLSVFFFGGESVRNFVLVLILGVFFGTYSSIFIASPILVVWHKLRRR